MSEEKTDYMATPPSDATDNQDRQEMINKLKAELEATKQQLVRTQQMLTAYQNLINGVKLMLAGATG